MVREEMLPPGAYPQRAGHRLTKDPFRDSAGASSEET